MNLAISQNVAQLLQGQYIENASLLYEKFLLPCDYGLNKNKAAQKEEALKALTQARSNSTAPRRTKQFIELLEQQHNEHTQIQYARLESRLAINLGDGLLENAGIALDRTLGSPYIPGSAFKGCCHHAAYWMVKRKELEADIVDIIFGTGANEEEAHKGCITFLPAHPIENYQIGLDILTPHPREDGREKSPVPNKYPVVEAGVRFAFIYMLNSLGQRQPEATQARCLKAMQAIIEQTFENGFGAKTAAGHGWFVRDTTYEQQRAEFAATERAKREAEAARIAAEKAEAKRIAEVKAEQEAKRLENEARRKAEAAKEQARLANASPEERFKLELEKLSKDDFAKQLKQITDEPTERQHIILDVFKSKNSKNQKKFLKDKKIGPALKSAAQQLGVSL
jgi:CRISPR type III-B/RAMP module RAMP protein Cmr6